MGPPASVFLCVGPRSQLTFRINNGMPHLSIQHNSANLEKSLFSLPLLLMHLLHHNWILTLLKEIKTETETCYCSKKHWYPKIGDLSGSWLLWWVYAGWSMHSSGRRREDGPEGAWSPLFLLFCVGVCGWEWKAAASTLSYESGSKLTAWWLDLISSHWISDSDLFLLCERRDASSFSIHVTMTMQYECVWYWKECVVNQYCTSALRAVHKDHCLAALCLSRNWHVGCHYTNKGVFTKCRFVSEAYSLCLSCAFHYFACCAQRWFGKLGAHSAVAQLMKAPVTETPLPRYHPWFLSPSITLPLLFLSHSSDHLLPQDHQPSRHFKQLLVFVEA